MASVQIHGNTDRREGLDGVVRAFEVRGLSLLAVRVGQVGDQVGKRVGLNDGHDLGVGVFLDSLDDLVNVVVLILVNTIVVDEEFTV